MSAHPATDPPADALRVWRVADVADYYRRSVRTVERWVAAGQLPAPRRDPGGRPFWPAEEIVDHALSRPRIVPAPQRRPARTERRGPTGRPLGQVVIGGRQITVRVGPDKHPEDDR